MKKLLLPMLCLLAATFSARAIQQDLSFLTNRTGLISYALRQVTNVAVSAYAETSPNAQKQNQQWTTHNGEATVRALAKTASLVTFDMSVADTNGYLCVTAEFYGPRYTGQTYSPLFTASACSKPIYDTNAGIWKLPVDDAQPGLYLASQIFIKAPGVSYAALITTNRWGSYVSRQLAMDYWNEGFWFNSDMCGGGKLVTSGWEPDGNGNLIYNEWVYDLDGSGQKHKPTLVQIAIALRDSDDMRDFGLNPDWLGTYVYTYTITSQYGTKDGMQESVTYGKIPLLIAKYNKTAWANIYVGSGVGTARSYKVKNLTTGAEEVINVASDLQYASYQFKAGVYHIIPLGINITPDWWRVQQFIDDNIPKG